MPIINIHTNLPADSPTIKDGVEERIAKTLAEMLDKPLDRIVVVIVPGVRIFRKGSTDPACIVNIGSIARFDKERNPGYTGPIIELLTQEFGVSAERISLVYQDLDPAFVA